MEYKFLEIHSSKSNFQMENRLIGINFKDYYASCIKQSNFEKESHMNLFNLILLQFDQ